MSMRALESAITSEARRIFNNPKLRVKDLKEWSTGQIKSQDGEVVEKMPLNGVYVAIKAECDKRSNGERNRPGGGLPTEGQVDGSVGRRTREG